MADLITGIFYSRKAAEATVDELETLGYKRDQISVLMHDETRAKEFADVTGTAAAATGEKSSTGAKVGASVGGALTAIVAGIAAKRNDSSDQDTVVTPTTVAGTTAARVEAPVGDTAAYGVRTQASSLPAGEALLSQPTSSSAGASSAQDTSRKPFMAGPLGVTLAGASLGGLIGALAGAGVDKKLADRYEQGLKAGGIVIGVEARPDSAKRVRDVLRNDMNSPSTTGTGSLS